MDRNVARLIANKGAIYYESVLKIIKNTLTSFKSYHASGKVYGAVIPVNILVYPEEEYRVELRQDISPIELPADLSGLDVNDLLGLSPEHFIQNQALDHRSDLYGVGYLAYYLLTSQANPYGAQTAVELVEKIKLQALPDPSLLNSEVPEWLSRIVQKLTAPDPSQRYQSIFSLFRQIESGIASTTNYSCISMEQIASTDPQNFTNQIRREASSIPINESMEPHLHSPSSFGKKVQEKNRSGTLKPVRPSAIAIIVAILAVVIAITTIFNQKKKSKLSSDWNTRTASMQVSNSASDYRSSALISNTNDEAEIMEIVSKWTAGLNSRDFDSLFNLYANNVHYYGEYLTPNEIVRKQRELLDKYHDFNQSIVSEISSQKEANGEVRIDFTKRVLYKGKIAEYPSYLVIRSSDSSYKIVTESDLITDRNLNKMRK